MVTAGVTRRSTRVSLETAFPASAARMARKSTASGPPAPPMALAACPTAAREKSTRGGAWRAYPMATAIAGADMAEAKPPISTRKGRPSCWPRVLMMVPMSSEQNSPCAMAPRASMPYRRADISIFFRLRKVFMESSSLFLVMNAGTRKNEGRVQVWPRQ